MKRILILILVFLSGNIWATDLPADFIDGNILTADELNAFKNQREGSLLPISNSTFNYTSGAYDIGSSTYKWYDGWFSHNGYVGGVLNVGGTSGTRKMTVTTAGFDGYSISNTGFAHGMTTKIETDTTMGMYQYGPDGGLYGIGISKSVALSPFSFDAMYVNDPSAETPAYSLIAGLKSGTGITALGETKTILQIKNSSTSLFTVMGSGKVGIGQTSPRSFLDVLTEGTENTPETSGSGVRIIANSTSITSRKGMLSLESNSAQAADIGASLVFTGRIINSNDQAYVLGKIGGYKENSSNGNVSSYLAFATPSSGGSLVEAMRIDSLRSILVGTTLSTFSEGSGIKIVRDSALSTLRVESLNTGASALEIKAGNSESVIDSRTSSVPLIFKTVATERLRISSAGNIGIGTTDPLYKLDIAGTARSEKLILGSTTDSDALTITNAVSLAAEFSTSLATGYSVLSVNNSDVRGPALLSYGASYASGTQFNIGAGGFVIKAPNPFAIGTTDNGDFILGSNNTKKVWLKPSGFFGINESAPSGRLHIAETTNGVDATINMTAKTSGGSSTTAAIVYDADNADVDISKKLTVPAIDIGANGTFIKIKILSIGDWNMDSTGQVTVAHGVTSSKIVSISGLIISDDGASRSVIGTSISVGGAGQTDVYFEFPAINATNVVVNRHTAGRFDNTSYNDISYNRGFITVIYTE